MYKLLTYFVLLCLFNSCAQLSLFQDARTVGKNQGNIGVNLSAYGTNDNSEETFGVAAAPSVQVYGSYGITEKVDIQLSLSSQGNALIAPKFQFLGDDQSRFAAAINPGVEFQIDAEGSFILRSHLGLITSMHPSENLSIFLEPKWITQFVEDDNFQFPGATLGAKFALGDRAALSVGASLFGITGNEDVDANSFLYQAGLGYTFKFGGN